MSDKLPCCKCM